MIKKNNNQRAIVRIIEYRGNKSSLMKLIEELQDYLIKLDPLKRLRRTPNYGEVYIDILLKKIKKQHGKIYIAEFEGSTVGMVAGVIERFSKMNKIGCQPSRPARILELVVNKKYRGRNIGSMLISKMEEYFKAQGCDIIRIEVFDPNHKAHHFYQKYGYQNRTIDMIKRII